MMDPDRGPVGYRLAKALLARPLRSAYEVDIDGIGHVPDRGGVIVAANHRSFMDSVFLAWWSTGPCRFWPRPNTSTIAARPGCSERPGRSRCGGAGPPGAA